MPEYIGPFGLTWYRVMGVCLLLWVIDAVAGTRERVPLKMLPRIALAAFCGVGFNMVTFMTGLEYTTPISAAVLMVTTPIIVLALSALFFKERLTRYSVVGILVGFSGAAMLILASSESSENASNPTLGNFLMFVNALSYSFYIILAKKLTAKLRLLTLMKWLYLFGFLLITPFGIKQGLAFDYSSASLEVYAAIGYVVLFATFGTYMLNIVAIKNLRPSVVAVFIYLQPLLAGIIAVGLGKDSVTLVKIAAAALIFGGVFITTLKRKKADPKLS